MTLFELLIPILLYTLAQLARGARLFTLANNFKDIRFRIPSAHFTILLPSLFLPFKLGEILRVFSFLAVTKHRSVSVLIWIVERSLDASLITIFLVIYLIFFNDSPQLRISLVLMILFCAMVAVFIWCSIELPKYLRLNLTLHSSSNRSLYVLKKINSLEIYKQIFSALVLGRVSLLIVLTFIIWMFELMAFGVFAHFLGLNASIDLPKLFTVAPLDGLFTYQLYSAITFFTISLGMAIVYVVVTKKVNVILWLRGNKLK